MCRLVRLVHSNDCSGILADDEVGAEGVILWEIGLMKSLFLNLSSYPDEFMACW